MFKSIKAAFRLFIATVENNTAAIEALRAEQTQLRASLDTISTNTSYLAVSKREERRRQGHKEV